jgi:pimeloyl-ACP methyl ester carboxylesterase
MQLPLVLIPGLLCDHTVWSAQITALHEDHELTVIDHAELDSIIAMAHAVLHRAPTRFALAGHSMGGRVALQVLRLAPERVTQLALLDTGYEARAEGSAGADEVNKRYALIEIARTQGMRAMAVEWARGMVHPDRLVDVQFMNRMYDMIAKKTVSQFAAQIHALLNRPNAAEVLASIRCPTLVLCGRQDTWSPWSRHVEMAEHIANSALIGIDHCGHMSPMEQPDAVTAALIDWLR